MSETSAPDTVEKRSFVKLILSVLPLAIFLVVGFFLFTGLFLKPRDIPSALIDKPAPTFNLAGLEGRSGEGLSTEDLKGEISLVNVFASWCGACRVEHPLLMRMAEENVLPIHGLNYKDGNDAAVNWLNRFGDPYTRVGADVSGRVGIDWGVYGVPESFLIDKRGHIVCKIIGPITPINLEKTLQPAIDALKRDEPVKC